MRYLASLVLISLLSLSVLAQTEGQQQVRFLQADAASVTPVEDGVAILVEGLKPGTGYGVLLDVLPGVKWIEVHDVKQPFPPLVQEPFREGQFLIRGEPGQRFYVSQRGEGLPIWIVVEIEGEEPPPPIDPPTDFEWVTAISANRSAALNDPSTAAALKAAINATVDRIEDLCSRGLCPSRGEAGQAMVAEIERVMLARRTPNKDWLEGWRRHIQQAINDAGEIDTETYLKIMRAAAKGL